jgi:hypothetical protein
MGRVGRGVRGRDGALAPFGGGAGTCTLEKGTSPLKDTSQYLISATFKLRFFGPLFDNKIFFPMLIIMLKDMFL